MWCEAVERHGRLGAGVREHFADDISPDPLLRLPVTASSYLISCMY